MRPHVERDVSDGDMQDEAAFVGGIAVRLGMDRVVVIFRVRRIDGDEGNVAPVLAALEGRRLRVLGFAQRFLREDLQNLVGLHGDPADPLLR